MPERIDAFAHVLPREFYEEMDGAHPTETLHNLAFDALWDRDTRLDAMDAHGIDRQVVSLANPAIWRGLDPEDALPLTRSANDAVHAFAAASDRLVPIGTLPFAGGAYVDELRRCVDDLGMAGVQLFTNVDGAPIDSPGHMAVYDAAAAADAPIWLHPQMHEWYDWLNEYEIHRTFGWPFDTTVALARLAFSGVFDRYPALDVVTHHLGGMLPYYSGRLSTFVEARVNNPETYPDFGTPAFDGSIEEQFESCYGDTVIGGAEPTLACGRSFFGDDRVVFATDYPFGPDDGHRFMAQAVDVVDGIEDDAVRHAVFAGNATTLLGR